jgi:putative flippase GtrA
MNGVFVKRELILFLLIGGIGFCVDGGLLTVLMWYGWDVIPSRLFSFPVAVSVTWILNRLWTFDSESLAGVRKEYACYFGVQIFGATINLLIFLLLIGAYSALRDHPLIPLAVGAAVSFAANYMLSKAIVFKRRK